MISIEKTNKILNAKNDIIKLNNILENGNFQKSENSIAKILNNFDYAKAIIASRAKHKIPYGNVPFGSLTFMQQRKVVLMLLEAVYATITELELTLSIDKDEKQR
ncbi:MAG: hypothetical protein NC037_04710 [Bacteroides sp.]|nr:hypothetical protein [Bacillota bacterium]MCM1393600.1 hypothetical protein [[Eubacterium] siraeum]MCM1455812.1 hypothetical protein [Bacteroides sp.]